MLSSFVAGLAMLQVQEPVKDFRFPVMSIQEFGAWYGKESGEYVIVSGDVADRDVYINVKQRTAGEVL